jgi:hypothetical protein
MNRAKVQSLGQTGPQSDSAFGASVASIDRKSVPDIALPVQPSIFSADSVGPLQLEQLYPVSCIDSYRHEYLRPKAIDPSVLTPPGFQSELFATRKLIREMAGSRSADARRIGRLARVLDEHDTLCRLAQMYASALLQG